MQNPAFSVSVGISRPPPRRWVPPLKTQCLEKFDGKWGTKYLNIRFPLPYPVVCGIQREADLIWFILDKARNLIQLNSTMSFLY